MKLYSRQHGAGEQALIILHGLLGSSANWQSLAKRFRQKRSVYTLDLRNHGQSPWSDTMNYAVMAQDVLRFMDELDYSNFYVLGHSMGGKTAMQLALDYPDRLDKLIIADIAPVPYQHEYDPLIEAMLAIDLENLENRAQADRLLEDSVPEAGVRAFLLHNLAYRVDQKQWFWRPNLSALLANMPDIIGFTNHQNRQFIQPSLFIHGTESNYVIKAHHTQIYQLFPQARFKSIEQAGHWLHAEQPQAFVAACEQFLSHTY